jgi:hypothetical protein
MAHLYNSTVKNYHIFRTEMDFEGREEEEDLCMDSFTSFFTKAAEEAESGFNFAAIIQKEKEEKKAQMLEELHRRVEALKAGQLELFASPALSCVTMASE